MPLFKDIKGKLEDGHKNGYSLEARFITTFLALLITFLLAVGVILAALGVFNLNSSKTAALLEHELNTISGQIKTDFNTVTSYAVNLSDSLSHELGLRLEQADVKPSELRKHPDILNTLLDGVFPTMSAEIRALKSSGVFLILDATVNPALENADRSRAGIFIKNIAAQNNLSANYHDLRYLYGPISLAQNRKMQVLPQWSLEFDVTGMDIYNTVMEQTKENPSRPLSQLYYWTAKASDGGADYGMYCSVPVIIDGVVVGVCGYEINVMQFKLSYAPEVSGQNYSFCMLAPSDHDSIYFENAMFAGNYAVAAEQPSCTVKKPSGGGFLSYGCGEAGEFVGNHTDLSLYSNSSVYGERGFSIVLLTPKSQITEINRASNMKYIGGLAALFLLAAVASVVLCRYNMRPVKKAFDDIRKSKSMQTEKTRVREIDDLFEFLSERDREHEDKLRRAEQERQVAVEQQRKASAEVKTIQEIYGNEITPEQYDDFVAHLRTLTNKEREVYDQYLQGKKAAEIAVILGITLNTVKYHNKNIYEKLGINSRKELLRYAKYRDGGTGNDEPC